MLDPVSRVAFAVGEAKGVYALLLGSGISRGAEIPTGWAITLELVRKIAKFRGEHCGDDPEGWYRATFGDGLDYSKLLNAVAHTPAERQRLLSRYFERVEGDPPHAKRPTAAHRAIAQLVAKEYIRVIVTPNFDRLLEAALNELGIEPTVVSSADQAKGAVPLVHDRGCLIIKVHGDYKDTRIKNTAAELAAYEEPLERLLARVFEDFGLIVCGWSADYDAALKTALTSAQGRYSMFWTAINGVTGPVAQALIQSQHGVTVPIEGADQFFTDLMKKIDGAAPGDADGAEIESDRAPHALPLGGTGPADTSLGRAIHEDGDPTAVSETNTRLPAPSITVPATRTALTIEDAVAKLKAYLPEPRDQIRLQDLVDSELNTCLDELAGHALQVNAWAPAIFVAHAARYEAAVERLSRLAFVAGRWSTVEQAEAWAEVVIELSKRAVNAPAGIVALVDLMNYPASLVLFAFGLGAVLGRRPREFGAVAAKKFDFGRLGQHALGDRLNSASIITDGGQDRFKSLPGYEQKQLPASDRIFDILRGMTRRDLRDDDAYERSYAEVEMALSLGYAERETGVREPRYWWAPPGRYVFRPRVRQPILQRWREEFEARGNDASVSLMAGLTRPPEFDKLEEFSARFW